MEMKLIWRIELEARRNWIHILMILHRLCVCVTCSSQAWRKRSDTRFRRQVIPGWKSLNPRESIRWFYSCPGMVVPTREKHSNSRIRKALGSSACNVVGSSRLLLWPKCAASMCEIQCHMRKIWTVAIN